jgi:Archaeal/vacuolar-type H+-ATPase subunit I
MIEKMTHIAIMCKAADKDSLLKWLYAERGFHVMPLDENDEAWTSQFSQLPDDTQAVDAQLNRMNSVVAFCQEFVSKKPGFLDAMLPLKAVGTKTEIDEAVLHTDIDAVYDKTSAMRGDIEQANEDLQRLQNRKASIEQFAFLGEDLPRLQHLKNVALEVVAVSGQGGKAFLMDERIADGRVVADQLFADQTHAYYALASAASGKDDLKELIDDHGLHVHPIPHATRGAKEELTVLANEIAAATDTLAARKIEAAEFSDAMLTKVSLVAGHCESEKSLAAARNGMSASSHLFVTRGYIKTENMSRFEQRLETAVPSANTMEVPVPEGEEPPVSLKWSKWISPASLLVKMYGLPSYYGLDPTAYIAPLFFAFVGICLGDAVYGLALILIMTWLKKKYRDQEHLQDFFQCFVYCGVTSIVVGFLTGSFAGNLTSLIPGFEAIDAARDNMALIDPIKDSQLALYIAIGIGVVSQIYAMVLRMIKDLKRGDVMGAFADGLMWILFLVFALGTLGGSTVCGYLLAAVCVVLVLTQGRDQSNWFSKIIVGCIALYGIVGSYGASAVLGDLISYARLMALSLTSAALGSTFNMLAELSVDIPFVGVIVAVMVVVLGHTMNFFLGLLGGFVHSARLIMLEFFGRFYDAGGAAYKPYGFDSPSVNVKKERPE